MPFIADTGLAIANQVRISTGRPAHAPNVRVQAVMDRVACEAAERRRLNDSFVAAAIDRYAPAPSFPANSGSETQRIRDAARAERYQPSAPATSQPAIDAASHHSLADTASIRNDARAARYA